jgi:A/G-specific adenine glycosylase
MRAAARRVAAEHGGRLPADHDRLLDLPGIGRYMAGAIMSIAFNEPYPIVDGNVRRVLARLNGWIEPVESELWNSAGDIVRSGVPRTVNQAMMELGATVCTFRAPDCESCPWKRQCVAHRTGRQAEIPAARKRPKTIRVDLSAVVDSSPEGVLMREAKGLWEFPMLPAPPGPAFHRRGHCRHWITHHRLEVDVYEGRLAERDGCRRVRFEDVPVTSLTRKIHAIVSASRDDASSKRPTGPIEP